MEKLERKLRVKLHGAPAPQWLASSRFGPPHGMEALDAMLSMSLELTGSLPQTGSLESEVPHG